MKYDEESLRKIFNKTSGKCHICHKKLAFKNFGSYGEKGASEIEHSVPKSQGGTNNLNNLLPAHISCNRHKSNKSTRAVRNKYGYTRAPYSQEKIKTIKKDNSLIGGVVGLMLAVSLETNPIGLMVFSIGGMILGENLGPDE